MSTTLWQIKTLTWDAMVQKSTSTTYNTVKLWNAINELSDEIIWMKVYNDLTRSYLLVDRLFLNEWKVAINHIWDIVLESDIAVGDVEITLDTTNLDTSGTILLEDDLISYTAKTATSVTGVTGILKPHEEWAAVIKPYVCPDSFYKPIFVYSVDSWRKTKVPYITENNRLSQYYEVKKEWWEQYIVFRWLQEWYYYIEYLKDYQYLTTDSAESIFPDIVCTTILPKIVWWRLLKDEELRQQLLNEGFWQLANYFNRQTDVATKPKWITWTRYDFNSIR
jgi:hypothetical protein